MLDAFGKLAIVELVFYPPILLISFFVLLRTGLRRGEGWIFLCLFCSGVSLSVLFNNTVF